MVRLVLGPTAGHLGLAARRGLGQGDRDAVGALDPPAQIFTCNGTASQKWVPVNGELVNPLSGRCLTDPASSTINTTQLQVHDCHQGTNQTWDLPA